MKIINIIIGFLFNVKLIGTDRNINRIETILKLVKLMPISKHKNIIERNDYDWQQALDNAYGIQQVCAKNRNNK